MYVDMYLGTSTETLYARYEADGMTTAHRVEGGERGRGGVEVCVSKSSNTERDSASSSRL